MTGIVNCPNKSEDVVDINKMIARIEDRIWHENQNIRLLKMLKDCLGSEFESKLTQANYASHRNGKLRHTVDLYFSTADLEEAKLHLEKTLGLTSVRMFKVILTKWMTESELKRKQAFTRGNLRWVKISWHFILAGEIKIIISDGQQYSQEDI